MNFTKIGTGLFSWLAIFMLTTTADAFVVQERESQTLAEFREYLGERLAALSDDQLDKIVKQVDADNDGKISATEFEDRMVAVRAVMRREAEEANEEMGSETEGDKSEEGAESEEAEETAEEKAARRAKAAAERAAKRAAKAKADTAARKANAIKVMKELEEIEIVKIPALVESNDAPVLLITADELAEAWVPFAKWKTQNGKLTKIVTVAQINKDYTADSIQEKIRLCVRQHIDNHNTRWLVLGGDCLPGGKGLVPGGHTTVHAQEPNGIPTDIVYLSPTNWDADGDGLYGEFKDDRQAITYPDGTVGMGRIPVRTAADIKAFTDKVIAYESKYPTDKFAGNMIYTCTDEPAYAKVRNSWDEYVSKVWDGEVGRFFNDETPWDEEDEPGSYDLTAENLVKLMNESSVGKIHIHGHGHLPLWALEDSSFTGKHVKQLTNDGNYPLITTVSCNTGEFDSKQDPSIVEQMLRVPRAGSVAIVAPIRTGKAHMAKRSDFRLMVTKGKLDGTTLLLTNYWKFGLGEAATTGHAFMQSKNELAETAVDASSFHLCVCELNLLGDPTLDMRAAAPRSPALTSTVSKKGRQWKVSVSTDAPGATICLWNQKNVYDVATADEKGNATFTVSSPDGKFAATVSGASLNSVSAKVTVDNRP